MIPLKRSVGVIDNGIEFQIFHEIILEFSNRYRIIRKVGTKQVSHFIHDALDVDGTFFHFTYSLVLRVVKLIILAR